MGEGNTTDECPECGARLRVDRWGRYCSMCWYYEKGDLGPFPSSVALPDTDWFGEYYEKRRSAETARIVAYAFIFSLGVLVGVLMARAGW